MASDQSFIADLGFRMPSYAGPTGIVGVLHNAASEAGFETVSMWAPVSHYAAGLTNAKGSLAWKTNNISNYVCPVWLPLYRPAREPPIGRSGRDAADPAAAQWQQADRHRQRPRQDLRRQSRQRRDPC